MSSTNLTLLRLACLSLPLLAILTTGCHDVSRPKTTASPSNASRVLSDSAVPQSNTEEYRSFDENDFQSAIAQPLSTFSIDVDTASYSNVRRLLRSGQLPPNGAVRIEELVNYFEYEYAEPSGTQPISMTCELAACPWKQEHQLMRIGLRARSLETTDRKKVNLVFLLDVSGSMQDANKLPLVQSALRLLIRQLKSEDQIAIAVYAGSSGVVLSPTPVRRSDEILEAIDSLQAGGGTAGSQGIQLAYQLAAEQFDERCVNRVILCSDGDFNLGVTDESSLVELIRKQAQSGVELTVLGFGTGNWKDAKMELLAQHGNGNFAYIDSVQEAQRVLVQQLGATLQTVARDVKVQVDFNPRWVEGYRLIGYENRIMNNQDFRDEAKDAGEMGAGHTVTALYEIKPAKSKFDETTGSVGSTFVTAQLSQSSSNPSAAIVRLRYKSVESKKESEIEVEVNHTPVMASDDFRFAASVASFGMLLRDSKLKGDATWSSILETAQATRGRDPRGMRFEFAQLVQIATDLHRSAGSRTQNR